MRHILLFLSFLFSLGVSARRIEAFVGRQMAMYPKSHLLDIYKSCFQDYMGAEHLVTDRGQVKAYFDEELNTTGVDDMPQWHYELCGMKGRYVRVSLRTVKEGLITEEVLLDAFIRSANRGRGEIPQSLPDEERAVARKGKPNGTQPSVESWKRQWHKIVAAIDRMDLGLPDYEKEKQFIDDLLAAGKYAVSHSPDYREAYHPHYRIVERSIFERQIRPKIEAR